MKSVLFIIFTCFFLVLYSCSDSTDSGNNAILKIRSEMIKGTVSIAELLNKDITILKSEVDSLRINRIRILLSEIKFHSESESNDSSDKFFKAGPFLFVGDSTGTYFELTSGQIPAGLYEKIKFEIHRFSTGELAQYQNDASFGDFATADRYSVIIEGISYKNGNANSFTYNGTPTANLSLKFEPSINLQANTTSNIYLQVNPVDLIKSGNSVLDPEDSTNENDIDNLIKSAIKAIKR
ncbi:MAG: hypothetical protein HZB41_07385 [Ignavibacteriae bacterium]|nr:hypothetical protein [Ignavibacteriota bacterium]